MPCKSLSPALPRELLIHRLPLRLALKQRLGLLPHRKSPLLVDQSVARRSQLLLHLLRLVVVLVHLILVEFGHVLQRLRPHEWALQFYGHPLDARRPVPSLVLRSRVVFGSDCVRLALGDALQFDVRTDSLDAHVVGVEKVIAQIQLAEPEGHGEAGEVWRLSGCAVERDVEVRPFVAISTCMYEGILNCRRWTHR